MPFKSGAQVRACFAQMRRDVIAGKKPRWDCYKWLEEGAKGTKKKSGKKSYKKSVKKSGKRSYKRTNKKVGGKTVYIGPRGGKFVKYKDSKGNERKVYV